jgi:N6-adenosine-specific RNA methylase IME4
VIYADPPWPYNQRRNGSTRFRSGVHGHYPVMTVAEIAALPVRALAEPRALLYLWSTFPRLEEALGVIRAWGFSYLTDGFVWMKTNPKEGTIYHGTGFYSKANAEVCLLARRGRAIKPAVDTVSSAILAPRREHSRKPDEAAERIERMYPDLAKVELFARERRAGWDAYGLEVDRFAGEAGAERRAS